MWISIDWSVTANTREQTYIPTVYEDYVADVEVDGKHVELGLWDMAGAVEYDRLRRLAYPDSHVILICFNIAVPYALENIQETVGNKLLSTSVLVFILRLSQWIGEVNHFCRGIPIILVGLQKELRRDPKTIAELRRTDERPVTFEEVG